MKQRKRLLKTYYLRRRSITKNAEGGDVISWGTAVEIKAVIWAAGGKVQAEIYGITLPYMKNMEYSGSEAMSEEDGICVYAGKDEDPDYKITSINSDHDPKVMMLEKIL